jgi:quercetin dioxygenase-like cupin family protein
MKFGAFAATFALGWAVCAAVLQDKKVVVIDSAKAEFKPVAPGASMAVVMGDPEKGKHAAFVKFVPGAKFDTHHHTNDLRLVVLKGAYVYKGKNGEEHRVGPGMFISTPGGDIHWSGGDEKEGALFYMEGEGKFDLIPEKK